MARKPKPVDLAVLKVKYDLVVEALHKADFDKAKAARQLSVDRKTIHNILKTYRKHFPSEVTQSA